MKIGLYGGSFDPIHYGHILPVRQAKGALGLDRVIYLPTARPPHKRGRERRRAPALARYAMVELALLAEDGFEVSTFELGEQVSFTADSLEHFSRRYPDARLFLILGGDSFARLDTWHRWRDILALAELAVLDRPDSGPPSRRLAAELDGARVHHVANAPVAASSTDIRRRIAARSGDLHRWLPPLVLDYIAKYELYGQARVSRERS